MFKIIPLIGLLALTAACAQPAYVHHAAEFNRSSPEFGKDITDIDRLTICYSSRGATPAQVRSLARDECAKFGKTAQFLQQEYFVCPLSTPVAARFSCLGEGVSGAAAAATGPVSGSGRPQVNYDGILFSY